LDFAHVRLEHGLDLALVAGRDDLADLGGEDFQFFVGHWPTWNAYSRGAACDFRGVEGGGGGSRDLRADDDRHGGAGDASCGHSRRNRAL
jgi:hypothetical protein